MDITDKFCNLECVQDSKVHEFIGPVKIVLMDPPAQQYSSNQHGSAFIGFAYMLIGATFIIMFLFNISVTLAVFSNVHVFFCTFGSQMCMTSAIIILNPLSGPAAHLKKSDRRCQHFTLQIIGVICYVFGTVAAFVLEPQFKNKLFTIHSICGVTSVAIISLAMIIGPTLYCRKAELVDPSLLTLTHRAFGISAFISTIVCFITGLIKPVFKVWALQSPEILVMVCLCSVCYTIIILFGPVMRMRSDKSKSDVK